MRTTSTPFYKSGDDYLPNNATLELGATGTRIAKIWATDGDFTSITIGTLTTGITNTQVVYSDAGVLSGDTGMTWTKGTDTLTIGGAAIKGGTNTFNILNGTAQLDVAAATSVNFDAGLQVTTNAGILAFTAASKTLNVEDTATVSQDYSSDASPTFAGLALGSGDVTTTGAIGRDTDNEIGWGTDDSLALVIAGTTSNIVSISTGTGDNDKLVTQGYVDDAIPATGANTALSNLASVALNLALLPDVAAADDFGSATLPFKDLWIAGTSGTPATNNFQLTGASTSGTRVITFPDATGTLLYGGGALGTPASGTLTSCTGLPIATGISGLGTGVATALAVNVGSAGAPIVFDGDAGTPSGLVGTNISGTAASLDIGGNAATVTSFTPASGSLTLAGADAVTITTTGATNSTLPLGTNTLAANDQTMYIGTTAVNINRTTAALTLAGLTLTTPDLGTPSALIGTNISAIPVSALANGTDGELITWDASGVAATVGVGTAAQVLTSNGAGVAPTFQAAGGGGMSLLASATLGTAGTTFNLTSIPAATQLLIQVYISGVASGTTIYGRFNNDSTAGHYSYDSRLLQSSYGGGESSGAATSFKLSASSISYEGFWTIQMYNPTATNKVGTFTGFESNDTSAPYSHAGSIRWIDTSEQIDEINIFSGENMNAGSKILVYGIAD